MKVLLYEDLLNIGLSGLHKAVDAADQAAATAALAPRGFCPGKEAFARAG